MAGRKARISTTPTACRHRSSGPTTGRLPRRLLPGELAEVWATAPAHSRSEEHTSKLRLGSVKVIHRNNADSSPPPQFRSDDWAPPAPAPAGGVGRGLGNGPRE